MLISGLKGLITLLALWISVSLTASSTFNSLTVSAAFCKLYNRRNEFNKSMYIPIGRKHYFL